MRTSIPPQFAAVEQHIRRAQAARAGAIAEVLAESIVGAWNAIKAVPALLQSDRHRAWRNSVPRLAMARH